MHCRAENLKPEREFIFHPERKWRFDFAFAEVKLAVEIEGGVYKFGGHNGGEGYEKDCEKYNSAVLLGWRVFRFSTRMVIRGDAINDVLEALKGGNNGQ